MTTLKTAAKETTLKHVDDYFGAGRCMNFIRENFTSELFRVKPLSEA